MIRDDPNLDPAALAAALATNYDLDIDSTTFLPIGFDIAAAVFRVDAAGGATYFLKTRTGPVHEPGLRLARALSDAGITSVVAPIPTSTGDLWCRLGDRAATLYPYVVGGSAMDVGMSAAQWTAFGRTLRAVHDHPLAERLVAELPVEAFDLASASLVREMSGRITEIRFDSTAAADLARLWSRHLARIDGTLARAEELGHGLRARPFELVPCHADIHAANIMVPAVGGPGGPIHLVDWDGPMLAPRERDLLFVVGSTIARTVEPHEEGHFFAGYGPVPIDPAAITYYRYERFLEDLGEIGKSVFLDPATSEAARQAEVDIAAAYFAPGGFLDRAETVSSHTPRLVITRRR